MYESNSREQRLVIVSNRLPIKTKKTEEGFLLEPGSGGLVTAMAPVLKDRGGVWIGWTGSTDEGMKKVVPLIHEAGASLGFEFEPVFLTKEDVDLFYYGFSNEIIWPLFHDLQSQCHFRPEYWEGYKRVNQKYADVILANKEEKDFIWVQDYQLMLLGQMLKEKGVKNKVGFFLHIPFPPLDIFLKLPWRFQIIHALLEYDLVGFQTMRDQRNFIQCLKTLIKDIQRTRSGAIQEFCLGEKKVRIGTFPISIDYQEFNELAHSEEVAKEAYCIHEKFHQQSLILSIDRLDYTKGIPYRLLAIRELLRRHPELHKKWSVVQVVVPSRTEIPKYQKLKEEIDQLVGEINSEFTHNSWVPIQYMFRSLTRTELLGYYRASEIMLVTPIKDGMNLVSKEYIASNVLETGALILSEFAGTASEVHEDAFLVNPYDVKGIAEMIAKTLLLPEEERRQKMKKMRRVVKRNDIFRWVESFLDRAIHKDLKDFPVVLEYIPKREEPFFLEV